MPQSQRSKVKSRGQFLPPVRGIHMAETAPVTRRCRSGAETIGVLRAPLQAQIMRSGRCRIRVVPTWWEQGREMPSIEERVAHLEGTVGQHTRVFAEIQHGLADLRSGLTELRTDMNGRFGQMEARFTGMEQRFDQRFAQMDQRFIWMFGTQLAVLLAVIAALAGAYYR